jgi:hypothetical protein
MFSTAFSLLAFRVMSLACTIIPLQFTISSHHTKCKTARSQTFSIDQKRFRLNRGLAHSFPPVLRAKVKHGRLGPDSEGVVGTTDLMYAPPEK